MAATPGDMTIALEKQQQPLLSDNEENAPLLGGGSAIEESPLERLISQSTLAQAAVASAPFFVEYPESSPCPESEVHRRPSPTDIYRISFTTLIAGTFCLLHIGLVWASFFSNAWFATHLTVTVGSGMPFKISTDLELHRTTLASMISLLLAADQEWPATLVALTCLVFPCLCMILCVSWTYWDYHEALTPPNPRIPSNMEVFGFDPRKVAEQVLIRTGFLAFFLLAILDVGTSSIAVENNNSQFLVTNRSLGGLACNVLGIVCSMAVVVVLRFASQEPYHATGASHHEMPPGPPHRAVSELRQPLLAIEDAEEMTQLEVGHSVGGSRLPTWKRIVAYECGVITVGLWLPALFLPLFRVNLGGLVAAFMDETEYEITLCQIPTTLLQRGSAAGTAQWIQLALGAVFLSLVFIVPLVATLTAVQAWRSPEKSKDVWFYKGVLRHLQPCLCGVIFSAALACAIPTFDPLVEGIFDSKTAGFCRQFPDIVDTMCLVVQVQPLMGHWFLLAQTISLEILVSITLLWKQ